jgi:hypothetical protein
MREREQPIRRDRNGEWVGNAEDLSPINSLLHRIQATAANPASAGAGQTPTTGNGGPPTTGQTGNNK